MGRCLCVIVCLEALFCIVKLKSEYWMPGLSSMTNRAVAIHLNHFETTRHSGRNFRESDIFVVIQTLHMDISYIYLLFVEASWALIRFENLE